MADKDTEQNQSEKALTSSISTPEAIPQTPPTKHALPTQALSETPAWLQSLAAWSHVGVPVLTLAAAVGLGWLQGLGASLLVLAGALLLGIIALLWKSLRVLVGEAPIGIDTTLWFASTPAEDDQKRSILRALKDLDYERSVGKINEQDFLELSARYRAEAKRLLRSLDEQIEPARKRAEELIRAHLSGTPLEAPVTPAAKTSSKPKRKRARSRVALPSSVAPSDTTAPLPMEKSTLPSISVPSAPPSAPPESALVKRPCAQCAKENDPDALFCKQCGNPFAPVLNIHLRPVVIQGRNDKRIVNKATLGYSALQNKVHYEDQP